MKVSLQDVKLEYEHALEKPQRSRLKAGDEGVLLAEYDVRWFKPTNDSILAPPDPPALIVTIPFQLKSQGGMSNTPFAASSRAKKARRHTMYGLSSISVESVWGFFGCFPKTIRLTRMAPRSLDSDNVVTALKPFRDQVCAWLQGKNTLDARANDSLRSGYVFKYGQQRQTAYGVRIEVSP